MLMPWPCWVPCHILLLASCSSYIILHCTILALFYASWCDFSYVIVVAFASWASCLGLHLEVLLCDLVWNPLFFLSPPHSCNIHIPATIHQVHPSFYSIQTSPFFFITFIFMWHFPCPENVHSFPDASSPWLHPLCQFSAHLKMFWLGSKMAQVWI